MRPPPIKRSKMISVLSITVCLLFPGIAWCGVWGENWGEFDWSHGPSVPTMNAWGVVLLAIILSVSGALLLARRRRQAGR